MTAYPYLPLRAALAFAGAALGGSAGVAGAQPIKGRPVTPDVAVSRVAAEQVFRLGPGDLTIGTEDEEGPFLFSAMMAMAVGPDGTMYVAEYPEGTIKAFDRRGRHLATIGRRGRGPGEFANPVTLLHDGDSTLYAAQGEFGTTEMTANAGRLSYRRTFGVGSRFRSLCLLGDSLLAAGWVDGHMLHVLGKDGRPVRAFGAGWSADTVERVRETANRAAGSLLCDRMSGRVVLTQSGGPALRAYAREGTLLWETVLPAFQPMFYVAAPGNGITMVGGLDGVENAVPLPGDRLLVQVSRVDYARAPRRSSPTAVVFPEVVSRHAFVLDARTGRILARLATRESLGLVVGNASYLVARDPFPTITRRPVRFLPP